MLFTTILSPTRHLSATNPSAGDWVPASAALGGGGVCDQPLWPDEVLRGSAATGSDTGEPEDGAAEWSAAYFSATVAGVEEPPGMDPADGAHSVPPLEGTVVIITGLKVGFSAIDTRFDALTMHLDGVNEHLDKHSARRGTAEQLI
ncbi:hypothetical protein NDU88_004959 [Pleurodeles waltl]|uniref:Uncharacterized protein n=1 Tax=Pleurodeles waltl TaxID=8319 RepID=A0AAV7SKF4_PLEWA|nr:hypothetical protein NDU88_004959 [Pleurodeles waltl]